MTVGTSTVDSAASSEHEQLPCMKGAAFKCLQPPLQLRFLCTAALSHLFVTRLMYWSSAKSSEFACCYHKHVYRLRLQGVLLSCIRKQSYQASSQNRQLCCMLFTIR